MLLVIVKVGLPLAAAVPLTTIREIERGDRFRSCRRRVASDGQRAPLNVQRASGVQAKAVVDIRGDAIVKRQGTTRVDSERSGKGRSRGASEPSACTIEGEGTTIDRHGTRGTVGRGLSTGHVQCARTNLGQTHRIEDGVIVPGNRAREGGSGVVEANRQCASGTTVEDQTGASKRAPGCAATIQIKAARSTNRQRRVARSAIGYASTNGTRADGRWASVNLLRIHTEHSRARLGEAAR